jgi:hypothetical protein
MLRDLELSKPVKGDYIFVLFPEKGSAKARKAEAIRQEAQDAFNAWTLDKLSGLALIAELFPSRSEWLRIEGELLIRSPGGFPPPSRTRRCG